MTRREIADEIRALEESLLAAEVRADPERLALLLTDEFMEFGSSGRVWDKAAVLQALPEQEGFAFSLTDFQARQLSDELVLATYRVSIESGGSSRRSLRSSLWVSRSGRWQVLFHQGTPSS